MRVTMVIQSFLPVLGGAQRQLDALGPELAKHGARTTVVTRRPPGAVARERRDGLLVQRTPGPSTGPLASPAYMLAGTAATIRSRPDVIHVHDLLSPASIALLAAPAVRAPIVAKVLSTGPGGDVDRLLTKPLGRRRLAAMARRFAAFVCLTPAVADELAEHGIDRSRLTLIPNGVDATRYRPPHDAAERRAARAALGLPSTGTVALYCGRFDTVKRLEVLIEAVGHVPDSHLVLVGEGPRRQELERLAAARRLNGRVILRDRVDDPAPLYRAADLYLSASSTEGMSNSVLEAMASGLPIVASGASGMDELVSDATGTLLPRGADGREIGGALDVLARDSARRSALGAAARGLVAERYSLSATAVKLVALYDSVRGQR